ncbi:hypothetical protein MUK42_27356 [Musa troglodytarum]|uniref:NAC domain-containing protein n=1 Tax=Musa troglodytarum TaxID=320322 RepID=A0A9E7F5L7_9LILI|nr:hypothetical protein MUK42_27356 [Musa troglodytarum]
MWEGCQFTQTDAELIDDYHLKKIHNLPLQIPPGITIPEMEVYKKAPWELMVRSSYLPTGVSYCFVRVPRSKARDNRLDRKTRGGTWVANGKPRDIPHQDRRAGIAGTRRSLKFFKDSGDPKKKNKKDSSLGLKWIMHEYRLHPSLSDGRSAVDGGGTCDPGCDGRCVRQMSLRGSPCGARSVDMR